MCDKFGYDVGGSLSVKINKLVGDVGQIFFAFSKTTYAGLTSYAETKLDICSDSQLKYADIVVLKFSQNKQYLKKYSLGKKSGLIFTTPDIFDTPHITHEKMLHDRLIKFILFANPWIPVETVSKCVDKAINASMNHDGLKPIIEQLLKEPNSTERVYNVLEYFIDQPGKRRIKREVAVNPPHSKNKLDVSSPPPLITPDYSPDNLATTNKPIKTEPKDQENPKVDAQKTEHEENSNIEASKIAKNGQKEKLNDPTYCQEWSQLLKDSISIFERIPNQDRQLNLKSIPVNELEDGIHSSFKVLFPTKQESGLSSLYVHNCQSSIASSNTNKISFTIEMVERNPDSYLSSGFKPLPKLYFIFGALYLIFSVIWIIYLCISKKKTKNRVYKVHFLMFAVILAKSLSVIFQAVDFHILGVYGFHVRGWSIMFYITHFIRGALFFTTILLIGAGWAFIKHMLTKRERYAFAIVVPLQVLANIAFIVIDESEEGSIRYATWRQILLVVDLICCGAILFPVLWSIKHLQTASQIDGKAAINLRKLKLFRQFYIMVISYVYLTRIIVYLLRITVYYNLEWTVELLKECTTLLFMVAVGVKFRPTDDNPYLRASTDDSDDEDLLLERHQLDTVRAQSGFTDGVTRVSGGFPESRPLSKSPAPLPMSMTSDPSVTMYDLDDDLEVNESARVPLIPSVNTSRFKNPNKMS